jgi:CRP/FNR family transcriptional regulator, anaerobic regulatory protein
MSFSTEFMQFHGYISQFVQPFATHEWAQVVSAAQPFQLRKGEYLTRTDEVSSNVYFVNSGLLRTCFNRDGADVTFGFFFENNIVTEFESFLTQQRSKFCIQALEDCDLIQFSYDDVQQLFITLTEGQILGRLVAERLYLLLQQRTTSLLFENPEERYRQLVLSDSPILRRVNQYHIASYLGITPQSLSRIRKRMMLLEQ